MDTETITNTTVAELVASDYRTAEVFKKHGIDFCCGGKKKIEQVCTEKNINPAELEAELTAVLILPRDKDHNYSEWSLSFLIDYIVNVHHSYVNRNLALITEFAEKVAKVHGHHNTETIEIARLWKQVSDELTMHMKKEELVLFPYIKNLEKHAQTNQHELPRSHFGTVKNPVRMMEQEHELAGGWLHSIQELSGNFTPPEYACNTYKVLYAKLNEFQNDLHTHIHLENNILFPKAEKMEEGITKVP